MVCIDAGIKSDGSDMKYGLEAIGKQVQDIRAILLTHWHNDHAAGAWALQQESGASVYYHQAESPFFSGKEAATGVRAWIAGLAPEWGPFILIKGLVGSALPHGVVATAFVNDGMVVAQDFEVIETPGHTPGHVAYYYRPQEILFAGDALAVIGKELRLMARPVTPDLPQARNSVKKCLNRRLQYVCPGHRGPLQAPLAFQQEQLLHWVDSENPWPLFG